MTIPFHRAAIGDEEISEVVDTLRSGWLTTGPKVKQFEADFALSMGFKHAVALNSATAALHLALEAIGLRRGEGVLVPTMTFAATAEVVRYFDAIPILVDCREDNLNIDVEDADRQASRNVSQGIKIRAILPVHYGGLVCDVTGVQSLARKWGAVVVDDAAHCCPAWYRQSAEAPWISVGAESAVCCFSFYANKCITTGEGGMACTNDEALATRMRIMSLHGISKDAWLRFTAAGSWRYEIIAPGYKYNLTDIAAAIGIHQLKKAERLLEGRRRVVRRYQELLRDLDELVLPADEPNRIHSWHLFAIRLKSERTRIDRAAFIDALKAKGIGVSVHWIPLHLHPYYQQTYGYVADDFPIASRVAEELVSLPLFPGMRDPEIEYVADAARSILAQSRR